MEERDRDGISRPRMGFPAIASSRLDPDGQDGVFVNKTIEFKDGRWVRALLGFKVLQNGDQAEFQVHLAGGETAVASKNLLEVWRGKNQIALLAVGKQLPASRIQALFADREGSLWIGTNRGLARWAGGKLEALSVTDPLATASVLALMEDHEGNIWVGTETGGLHILRDQRFRTFTAREALFRQHDAVVEGAAGKLWVGTAGRWTQCVSSAAGLRAVRPYESTRCAMAC